MFDIISIKLRNFKVMSKYFAIQTSFTSMSNTQPAAATVTCVYVAYYF